MIVFKRFGLSLKSYEYFTKKFTSTRPAIRIFGLKIEKKKLIQIIVNIVV